MTNRFLVFHLKTLADNLEVLDVVHHEDCHTTHRRSLDMIVDMFEGMVLDMVVDDGPNVAMQVHGDYDVLYTHNMVYPSTIHDNIQVDNHSAPIQLLDIDLHDHKIEDHNACFYTSSGSFHTIDHPKVPLLSLVFD